ncbi:glycosyltransferase [Rhodanobacter sp. 7MK24]|uniref:glycosyltransferase family 2 protein n=1 Tax=Rhodanobacter sp. 7MK24 TaxID=2775922 RepID=UPI00177B0C9A|nr:glycosyltransferase family 2 protein [Rhodanobacter sp. 7MK24]MBD8879669.1 glycosyltransferase [Rhodanobacter sp. 7MK24]
MPASGMQRVAVLVPCFNEAVAIGKVVRDFAESLPQARIVVYDNNSTDDTASVARAAGAEVRQERLQGKGNVVRRMFADVDADIYVMADGDATYDASDAPAMIQRLLDEHLDLVVGSRVTEQHLAYRPGHRFGNRMLTGLAGRIFGRSFTDMLSGYRVMSRRYVKSFPVHAQGFEIETELAVHALELCMPVAEVPSRYFARPEGSHSKLNTWRDGWRILLAILRLAKNGKPLAFFSLACAACLLLAAVLAWPLLATYLSTGLVPRFPTAILCASLTLLGGVFLVCGLVLDTVTLGRREQKHLAYLGQPAPGCGSTQGAR